MKTPVLVALGAVAMFSAGCSIEGPGAEDQDELGTSEDATTATQYTYITDFNNAQFQDQWFDIKNKLNGEFNNVCGDTFCEGDYSNLTPLTVMCQVSTKLGTVHDCAWTFAGELHSVDPTTAAITVSAPTYQCHFKPTNTVSSKFITFLQSSTDLHDKLPGSTTSIYDSLVDCFQHPIGATPVTFPTSSKPTYVDGDDYYTSSASQRKWGAAKLALKEGFDNVCGDTFCGSDYSDLQAMKFICSVTKSSGNLKTCEWVFSGSYPYVSPNGRFIETSQSWTCPVPVHGTISQLITTLTAAGSTDAIHRPLPGVTTSAYDAIANNCLP